MKEFSQAGPDHEEASPPAPRLSLGPEADARLPEGIHPGGSPRVDRGHRRRRSGGDQGRVGRPAAADRFSGPDGRGRTDKFSIRDVIDGIGEKLVRRHPHIFGEVKVSRRRRGQGQLGTDQDRRKEQAERHFRLSVHHALPAAGQPHRFPGFRESVSTGTMPPRRSTRSARRSRNCGVEIAGDRLREAENEIGDLLFAVANVARLLKINPEFALARANEKFTRRFRFIEAELRKQGKEIARASLAEMEALWHQAKTEIMSFDDS